MKKIDRKKLLFLLGALLALYLTVPTAHADAALADSGREGNGGGGVERDGRYMTFYSAGLYTEPFPAQDNEEVPGLIDLLDFFEKFPHLSDEERLRFIGTSLPSANHSYYKAKEDRFDEATLRRLIAEFSRVTGQPIEEIRLFAITDTQSRNTFLLPSFYQLTRQEQMTILFHENYWILNPKANYQTVIAAEMAFQAVLAKPSKMNRVLELLKYIGEPADRMLAIIRYDLQSEALKGLLGSGSTLPMVELLGEKFFACMEKSNYLGEACLESIKLNVYRLTQKYPHSLLLAYLNSRAEFIGNARTPLGVWYPSTLFCGKADSGFRDGIFWGCENRSKHSYKSLIPRKVNGFFGETEIDYSDCALDLNISNGFSSGVALIPTRCGSSTTFYDYWLSSAEGK